MKSPVLEVIRFDEADIITASGLGGLGFTADNFGDQTFNNGTFSFFDGSGPVTSVTTEADHNGVLKEFNSFFRQNWSSTGDIMVNGSSWLASLEGIINGDRYDDILDDPLNIKKYNGTFILSFDGYNYFFRSN